MSSSQELLLSPKTSGERLSKLLKAEEMDPILLATANLYLQEKSVDQIGEELGISNDRVAQILEKNDVQNYIQQCMLSQGFLNPLKSMKIADAVIESILLKSMESGELPTKKDLLEWLKYVKDMRESIAPKKAAPTVAVQVNNNINKLYEDLS